MLNPCPTRPAACQISGSRLPTSQPEGGGCSGPQELAPRGPGSGRVSPLIRHLPCARCSGHMYMQNPIAPDRGLQGRAERCVPVPRPSTAVRGRPGAQPCLRSMPDPKDEPHCGATLGRARHVSRLQPSVNSPKLHSCRLAAHEPRRKALFLGGNRNPWQAIKCNACRGAWQCSWRAISSRCRSTSLWHKHRLPATARPQAGLPQAN